MKQSIYADSFPLKGQRLKILKLFIFRIKIFLSKQANEVSSHTCTKENSAMYRVLLLKTDKKVSLFTV